MILLDRLPKGKSEIIKVYHDLGDELVFSSADYFKTCYLNPILLNYTLKISWSNDRISAFRAHRKVADSLEDALNACYYHVVNRDPLYPRELIFGGCYNRRLKADKSGWSTHAWGIAIDLNPELGRYGSEEDRITYPPGIVYEFESRGWEWGGRWKVPDPMHFQACTGY